MTHVYRHRFFPQQFAQGYESVYSPECLTAISPIAPNKYYEEGTSLKHSLERQILPNLLFQLSFLFVAIQFTATSDPVISMRAIDGDLFATLFYSPTKNKLRTSWRASMA